MCGIAGLMRFDQREVGEADLQPILIRIAHRGRDHQGIAQINPQLILGHRRLSIIDLNEAARQPMFFQQHLCVTYNGEIYNYRELKTELMTHGYQFKTASDTEVLLAAYDYWGENCVLHLNGMFTFALWDQNKKQLFCARDHLGIKPFYYIKTPAYFAFASESRALIDLTAKKIDRDALNHYLLTMYVPTQSSIFSGIEKLMPAHRLTLRLDGKLEIKRYWQLKTFADVHHVEEQTDIIHQQLKQAVKYQLQSDVPVGGFLSGGIDSGLVTALAAEHINNYHTYSIGYEGLGADQNELPFARKVAQRYATKHTEVYVSANEAMTYLTKSLQHMSEPIADSAIVGTYVLAECAAKDGVKVLLNGTGGDEIFSGYTRYNGALSKKRKLLMSAPEGLKNFIQYLPFAPKTKLRMKHLTLDMLLSTGGSYQLTNHLLSEKKLMRDVLTHLALNLYVPLEEVTHSLYQRMLVDLHTYLPHELLFLLDQMTMAHTLEGRVPLLDIDVVASAFRFQPNAHVQQGQTKTILKNIARRYLGDEHVQRKKQGFAGSPFWWVKQNFGVFIAGIAETHLIPGCENFSLARYQNFATLTPARANDIFILYCLNTWYHATLS